MQRKLYPNVDFYSGLIYQAMGFPVEMFPVLFAIPRTAGLARPVGRDAARSRAEDRPAAPDLHGLRTARLRAAREAKIADLPGVSPSCCRCWRRRPRRSTFDASRAWEHLRAARRARPAAGRLAGDRAVPPATSGRSWPAAGVARRPSRHGATGRPLGPVRMVNLIATIPGAVEEPARHRRPLRHQARSASSGSSAPTTAARARRSSSSSRAC